MNSRIRLFFISTALLVNSCSLFGAPKYILDGKKPSLGLPQGNWEEADQSSIAEQIALENIKSTITITNKGYLPFRVRTDAWECVVKAHETTATQPCTNETFLEILVGTKTGSCLVEEVLGLSNLPLPAKKLEIEILLSPDDGAVSAILNKNFAITLEDAPQRLTETPEQTFAIDSPVTSPKSTPEQN